jgi:hypothetical protein
MTIPTDRQPNPGKGNRPEQTGGVVVVSTDATPGTGELTVPALKGFGGGYPEDHPHHPDTTDND